MVFEHLKSRFSRYVKKILTLAKSLGEMLAALKALLMVLFTNAGELSPERAFCNNIVLAKISSSDKPELANSFLIAAKIWKRKFL